MINRKNKALLSKISKRIIKSTISYRIYSQNLFELENFNNFSYLRFNIKKIVNEKLSRTDKYFYKKRFMTTAFKQQKISVIYLLSTIYLFLQWNKVNTLWAWKPNLKFKWEKKKSFENLLNCIMNKFFQTTISIDSYLQQQLKESVA